MGVAVIARLLVDLHCIPSCVCIYSVSLVGIMLLNIADDVSCNRPTPALQNVVLIHLHQLNRLVPTTDRHIETTTHSLLQRCEIADRTRPRSWCQTCIPHHDCIVRIISFSSL